LSDAKPKLEQFAVDTRRTPKLVLRAHLPDQRAQFYLEFAGALPASSISNANSGESRPDATAPAFQVGQSLRPSGSMETIDTSGRGTSDRCW
jgi:hypothetical protein